MSTVQSNITAPEHWAEWFEKCALLKCGDDTRQSLGIFAHERYKRYFGIALREQGRSVNEFPVEVSDLLDSPQPGACWLDLEASYWHLPMREGRGDTDTIGQAGAKVYKKFHLEIASTLPSPEESRKYLEAKSTQNLIRNRCRSIISESIFRCGGRVDESGMSQEDSILEELQVTSQPSLLAFEVYEIAHKIFGSLTAEVKILILAGENNVNLANPAISARLELKKTILYERQNAAWKSLGPLCRKHQLYPEDIPLVWDSLLGLLTEWALSPECGIGECLTRGEALT